MGDGQMANNPWLQEFPDPISRASWDNYLTISKADALAYGFENINVANGGLDGSYATLKVGDVTLNRVPVFIQPGQAKGTVGLALGYGRKSGIQEEMQTGVNAYSLYLGQSKVQSVTIEKEREIVASAKQWILDRQDQSNAYRDYLKSWSDWNNPWEEQGT